MHNLNTAWRASLWVAGLIVSLLGLWQFASQISYLSGVMGTNPTTTIFLLCLLGMVVGVVGFVYFLGLVVYCGTRAVVALQGYYHLTFVRYTQRTQVTGINSYLVQTVTACLVVGILDLLLQTQLAGSWMHNWGVILGNPSILMTLAAAAKLLLVGAGFVLSLWVLIACGMRAVVYLEWYYHHQILAARSSTMLELIESYLTAAAYASKSHGKQPGNAESAAPQPAAPEAAPTS